jgi:hypothetical protein
MSAPFSYRAGICRCGLVPGPGFPVARWGQRAAPGRVVQVSGPGLHQVVVDCRVRRGLLAAAAGFVPKDAAGRCAATVRALLWRCCCRSRCLGEGAYRAAAGLRCQLGAGPGRLLPSGCSSAGATRALACAGLDRPRLRPGRRSPPCTVPCRAGGPRLRMLRDGLGRSGWRGGGQLGPGWDLAAGCG